MSGRPQAILPFAGVSARKKEARPAPRHELSGQERSMSVDDFRRLVEELYLAPESPLARTLLQDGAAVHNTAILVDTSGS
ncbi:MAG: hypothetical protein LBH94_02365, partial [Deltaproteobacteria bacterium]|nr:hypothetical protein [Deltaproteobacteria bacterium]